MENLFVVISILICFTIVYASYDTTVIPAQIPVRTGDSLAYTSFH